ncbi:MAG: methyltransferase domain-containing protein [Candidatus Methanoperedens sp.]|nr:methyltransferase domain-containing protein [Candidatus Methanoperedens sp.]MCE8425636.1 methyltransferase domain-containing protein [Candidatus Methanoperedens sp.]MCE8427342.1 methyltransferase domain-containing protein [Candidatus Methanoperedens sp.]
MRLDSYIVEIGNLASRGRAKRAIMQGHVKVNGNVILKPSHDVEYSDNIELKEGLDRPAGYWKLKDIQEKVNLIKPGDSVLDIGSSAGGFLMYAAEIALHVHGIEFSHNFRSELGKIAHEYDNITVEFGDVFSMPFEPEKTDCLLIDITADPLASLKALGNVLPSLKHGGMLLQVVKMTKETDREPILGKMSSLGLEIIEIMESRRKEAYIIARKL